MKKSKSGIKDPVCGMSMNETSSIHSERNGKTFYFCSDQCQQKFLSTPADAKLEVKSGDCC